MCSEPRHRETAGFAGLLHNGAVQADETLDEVAGALIYALGGDDWWLARRTVVDAYQQTGVDSADELYGALTELRYAVLAALDAGEPELAPADLPSWRKRLRGLLAGGPELGQHLRDGWAGNPAADLVRVSGKTDTDEGDVLRKADLARALVRLDSALRTSGPFSSMLPAPDPSRPRPAEEAAVVAGEALEAFRRLAARDPSRRPDLLRALLLRCASLVRLFDNEDAAAVGLEALALYRSTGTTACDPQLAATFTTLGRRLPEYDMRAEACELLATATEAHRRLAAREPGRYRPQLADTLVELFYTEQRPGEKLAAIEEAVAERRTLAAADQTAWGHAYGDALGLLRECHMTDGDTERAAEVAGEAVEVYRQLADTDPAKYRSWLASARSDHGYHLLSLSRDEEAAAELRLAADDYRRVAEEPGRDDSMLGEAQRLLGTALWQLGQRTESLQEAAGSLAIFRRLAQEFPAGYHWRVGDGANDLACHLSEVGRHAEALAVSAEAVAAQRRARAAGAVELALALWTFAEVREAAGEELPRAVIALEEAVPAWRELARADPEAHDDHLAQILALQAKLVSAGT
jgi:tetratricopeptide (TPR) repeat protein